MKLPTFPQSLIVTALLLFGAVVVPLGAQAKKPAQTNASFTSADGTVLKAYLAQPGGAGNHPGIILVHEWWGLSADIAAMADRLAQEGFAVLAVDAFRGKLAQTQQEAGALAGGTPPAQMAADLDAALTWLAKQPGIDTARLGAAGFCFGGAQAMRLGTRQSSLKAVVTLYGTGLIQKEADLLELGKSGAVLGIFGDQDGSIPPAQRQAFREALSARNARYAESVYTGVGHAFVKNETVDQPGPARQAWHQAIAFFKDELGVH